MQTTLVVFVYTAQRVAMPTEAVRLLGLGCGDRAGSWVESLLLGWHGASDEAVQEILRDGFNPCCAGKARYMTR